MSFLWLQLHCSEIYAPFCTHKYTIRDLIYCQAIIQGLKKNNMNKLPILKLLIKFNLLLYFEYLLVLISCCFKSSCLYQFSCCEEKMASMLLLLLPELKSTSAMSATGLPSPKSLVNQLPRWIEVEGSIWTCAVPIMDDSMWGLVVTLLVLTVKVVLIGATAEATPVFISAREDVSNGVVEVRQLCWPQYTISYV